MTLVRFLVLFILVFLPACAENEPAVKVDMSKVENIAPPGPTAAITYAYLPQYSHSVSFERHRRLLEYLRHKTGLSLRQIFPNTFAEHIKMVERGEIDISFTNPFVYTSLARHGSEAFARIVEPDAGADFEGQIIVRADNPAINTIEDCRGKRLIAVDPNSAGGYLYPLGLFFEYGITRDDFKEVAFMRICSGKYTKGMKIRHHRIGKEVQISNATIFMAQDRTGVEEAYAGDIIGLHNHGTIKIGDTFTQKEELKFTGIPSFAPEHFRKVILKSPLKTKQLQKGLQQLAEEGAVQVFRPLLGNEYILGAVGILQFDVIISRLKDEYSVDAIYTPVNLAAARWVQADDKALLERFQKELYGALATDSEDNLALLADSAWRLEYIMEQWPDITFHTTREKN